MSDWITDEQWLDESSPWFLPPPSHLNNSPMHSFGDYVYPSIERLVGEIIFFDFCLSFY